MPCRQSQCRVCFSPYTSNKLTVDKNSLKRRVKRVGALVHVERLQVLDVREFLEVSRDTDLVSVLRRRLEPDGIVQLLQTSDRDRRVARCVDVSARGGWDVDWRCGCSVHEAADERHRVEVEGRLELFHAREHRRRLDELDVVVQMLRKAVRGRADHSVAAGVVSPDVVFLAGRFRARRRQRE